MVLVVMTAAFVGHLLPHKAFDLAVRVFTWLPVVVRAALLVGLALGIKEVSGFEVQPFIYFQF